jgi:hypothetical protein
VKTTDRKTQANLNPFLLVIARNLAAYFIERHIISGLLCAGTMKLAVAIFPLLYFFVVRAETPDPLSSDKAAPGTFSGDASSRSHNANALIPRYEAELLYPQGEIFHSYHSRRLISASWPNFRFPLIQIRCQPQTYSLRCD